MEERREDTEDFIARHRRYLDVYAVAVGHLCFAWSHLEISIDSLLMQLVGIYAQEEKADRAASLVTSNMNLQKKLEIIKGVGFLKKLSDEWQEKLFAVVADIQAVGVKRNHFVHDFYWPMSRDEGENIYVVREEARTRLKKRNGEHVVDADEVEVHPHEIWDVVHNIYDIDEKLDEVSSAFWDAHPPVVRAARLEAPGHP